MTLGNTNTAGKAVMATNDEGVANREKPK